MSKINYPIPPQSFEVIRDRIGAILADEIPGQVTQSGNYDLDDLVVYIERTIPIDKTETILVNISLAGGDYDNKHQTSVRGSYKYNIDVYVNSKSTADNTGDSLSAIQLHEVLGLIRAILENPLYKTLDFTPPFISSTICRSIQIANQTARDAMHSAMGRIVFEVVAGETTEPIDAVALTASDTVVKLHLTEKGYKYQLPE